YHIFEAAASGADAILLIAAILDRRQLRAFRELAASFEMDALVEVHDEAELDAALSSGAEIIGVNNRNLRTFEVDLTVSKRLEPLIPDSMVKIAESGIFTAADIQQLPGYQAFLIGESLMKSGNPAEAIRNLCL
ncbi:MAG: indole-3-glycerol phosphate synthase TrpC, partial [Acidobacteriota bacterium]|nr:indole-3-glycerol phosphate synthase TrpC [Acidobacteriota bacterium]